MANLLYFLILNVTNEYKQSYLRWSTHEPKQKIVWANVWLLKEV